MLLLLEVVTKIDGDCGRPHNAEGKTTAENSRDYEIR